MARWEIGEHLVADSEICFGKLTFKNTRVPVDTVFAYLEQGCSVDEIRQHWSHIPREAVIEAIRLAGEALHEKHKAEIEAAQEASRKFCEERWLAAEGELVTAFVLDDQLSERDVEPPLRRWLRTVYLRHARPGEVIGEVIRDDRAETILHALKQPTFITIDQGFWNRGHRHPRYCILYFALHRDEQRDCPSCSAGCCGCRSSARTPRGWVRSRGSAVSGSSTGR